ncbi:MAG: acyl-CoA synthetase [Vicinamibacterales bacterium]
MPFAIVAPDGTLTYEELDLASRRVAAALLNGAADLEQARIAFFVPPSWVHVAVQRGIWKAGGVAVPLALSHPAPELEYVLRDSDARTVIADRASLATITPVAARAGVEVLCAEDALQAAPATELPHIGSPRRAMIIYTSGTTGRPKGVVSTHANIGAQVAALVEAWGWTSTDRILHVLPLHHVHGIINALCSPLAVHATCEMLPAFDATVVWERFASGEITVFTAVPTVYHRLIGAWESADEPTRVRWSAGARGLRLMMSGSAALPVKTLERWRTITGHTLLERYGMTEIGMALSNPLEGERRPGYVGVPLPGVELRLVNEAGNPVDPSAPGELEVRGPNVFGEYWRRPEETAAAFRDGWFRTGDMGVVEGGICRLMGRTSVDIIKTGGYKVSALEIEEVLRTHPAIGECAVVGIGDAEWGERVSVAVELSPGATLELGDLQQWAKAQLAPYKVPRALHIIDALPRNAMGKVVKPEVAKVFR